MAELPDLSGLAETRASQGLPPLRDPLVLAAFEGWNDAGDSSSAAIDHLANVWNATPLAAIDPEDYYDFQVNRPTVSLGEGLVRKIEWPTTTLLLASPPGGRRDVVLMRGIEPNMRWRSFCAELLGGVKDLGSSMFVTLGALLADVPHTRPVHVTGTASDEGSALRVGLEKSRYEGPTGILGVLQDAANTAGIPAISFWAAVPHYVAQPPCPKATLALLQRVEDLLDVGVPLGDLPEEAEAWEQHVNEVAQDDSEVADYVRALESREPDSGLRETSGDAIAAEFENYLRRRGPETT